MYSLHSPKRADKPEKQLIRSRQKAFILIPKNTMVHKNTRNNGDLELYGNVHVNFVVID